MTTATLTPSRPSTSAYSRLASGAPTGVLPSNAFIGLRPDPWKQVFADLHAMFKLQDDWDGLDAKAPTVALVSSALRIAEIYRDQGSEAPSRVTVTVNGTVAFEWQAGKVYTELEVVRPFYAEGMQLVPRQKALHWVLKPEDFAYLASSCPR